MNTGSVNAHPDRGVALLDPPAPARPHPRHSGRSLGTAPVIVPSQGPAPRRDPVHRGRRRGGRMGLACRLPSPDRPPRPAPLAVRGKVRGPRALRQRRRPPGEPRVQGRGADPDPGGRRGRRRGRRGDRDARPALSRRRAPARGGPPRQGGDSRPAPARLPPRRDRRGEGGGRAAGRRGRPRPDSSSNAPCNC